MIGVARCVLVLAVLGAVWGADQSVEVRAAVGAMQRGDFGAAEKILREEVRAHPDDAWALSLLGVALDNQKKGAEAEEFHGRAVAGAGHSAEILNNYGTHLWMAGKYAEAEGVFAGAVAAAPTYFTALLNLGVMATFTGHFDRAREVLTAALEQRPESVEALYRLAGAEEASGRLEPAVLHLAQAGKLDGRRSDVQKLLAVTTTELGALDDATAAWERYLRLEPRDEAARRELAYTWARMGRIEEAVGELERYVGAHPGDAVGHYELGQALRGVDVAKALGEMDRALELKPDYGAALVARGGMHHQQGKPELAVADLERAAAMQPEDAAVLDALGQSYEALERAGDAVRVLRRAAELAPEDSKIVLHYGRALADAGETAESKAVMERFRQLGPEKKKGVPAGLVDYLSLPAEQRRADYRARVEGAVRKNPEDAAAQVEYLKLAVEEGRSGEIAEVAKRIAGLKPGAAVSAQAGRVLLDGGFDGLALGFLEGAVAAGASGADVAVDLAFARAQAQGTAADVAAVVVPKDRPDLYVRAGGFLVKEGRAAEALAWMERGAREFPGSREVLLMRATTVDLNGRAEEGGRLLGEIERRWPEWAAPWEAEGLLLHARGRCDQARRALETALALGARTAATYYGLADCALRAGAEGAEAAERFIGEALRLAPEDAWVEVLAGRIALARGESRVAAERFRAAVRLYPGWREEVLAKEPAGDGSVDRPPYLSRVYDGSLWRAKPGQ